MVMTSRFTHGSVGGDTEVFADAMVVLEHLFVGPHIKVTIEPVEVAELEPCLAINYTSHLDRVATVDSRVLSAVVHYLDLLL